MFKFFMVRGWSEGNPAVNLKNLVVKFKQRMPFKDEEIEKILWATEIYPPRSVYGKDTGPRLRAFLKLLIYSEDAHEGCRGG